MQVINPYRREVIGFHEEHIQEIVTKFNLLKEREISIDITRGKPDSDQLNLSNEIVDISIPSFSASDLAL